MGVATMWDENIPYVNSVPQDNNPDASTQGIANSNPSSYSDQASNLLGKLLNYHLVSDAQKQSATLAQAGANVKLAQASTPAPGAGMSVGKVLLILAGLVVAAVAVKKLA